MAFAINVTPQARASYIALSFIARRYVSSSVKSGSSSQFHRSDFASQGFTGSYDPNEPTAGPLADSAIIGAPIVTPKTLKQHLDQYVIGQERAKKTMSVSVYNHYLRISELQRKEEEEQQRLQQRLRREKNASQHPLEDEYPGHQETIPLHPPTKSVGASELPDPWVLDLEKTNILLLGPSGVGKTLMARTLAKVLQVPFSMSDCTPFTQAGYIGEDAQICVERLLAAANYDVEAAENGIIVLDEVDKIAVSRSATGKDVGGEGVQQALLKIIEGTTLYIQAKGDKSSASKSNTHGDSSATGGAPYYGGKYSPASSTSSGGGAGTGSSKGETYTIRTDNILFVFTGAFIGLNKIILDRVAKGSIGFGSPLRSSSRMNPDSSEMLLAVKTGSEEGKIFEKNVPFFTQVSPGEEVKYNPLDLVEPVDLQKFGLIPEFTGRIPVTVALSALDEDALVRVLTEPRNNLIKQYEQIFQLSGIELRFTSGALREIAKSSLGMGTGARGLRTCIERLLSDAMFEAPGSSIKHVLITEAVAQRTEPPIYLARGQQHKFNSLLATEEEAYHLRDRSEANKNKDTNPVSGSFEEYRERSKAAGVM